MKWNTATTPTEPEHSPALQRWATSKGPDCSGPFALGESLAATSRLETQHYHGV